ncbi:MAG: PepSY domain-containing protein [Gammaproteobacteria bacterium]|nr:PepSY domain-containing protein [Gammaproteobacteria bacterium]
MRRNIVVVHRYLGLCLAGFLIFSALTGSLLAWYHELDSVFNPAMVQPPATVEGAAAQDPLTLAQTVAEHYPDAYVRFVMLRQTPGQAQLMGLDGEIDPHTGAQADVANDEVYVDRFTGEILGERKWGAIDQGMKNLMPFIYRLHYSLALDSLGEYLLGIVALLWTIDCFIGAYLTFPPRRRQSTVKDGNLLRVVGNWLTRWSPSWKVRTQRAGCKLNFDLHRAGGLWPWVMLFIIAWSSVGFNLSEVYNPVMGTFFPFQDREEPKPSLAQPQFTPAISLIEAREIGRRLMAAEARANNFSIIEEHMLAYDPAKALYRYVVKSDRDIRDNWGSTMVYFDASTGEYRATYIATGEAIGNTITHWLFSLHMAAVWGTPFKVFVAAVGLAVAMLSVTGILIWHRKRYARLIGRRRTVSKKLAPNENRIIELMLLK